MRVGRLAHEIRSDEGQWKVLCTGKPQPWKIPEGDYSRFSMYLQKIPSSNSRFRKAVVLLKASFYCKDIPLGSMMKEVDMQERVLKLWNSGRGSSSGLTAPWAHRERFYELFDRVRLKNHLMENFTNLLLNYLERRL